MKFDEFDLNNKIRDDHMKFLLLIQTKKKCLNPIFQKLNSRHPTQAIHQIKKINSESAIYDIINHIIYLKYHKRLKIWQANILLRKTKTYLF